jgi:nucleoside-diphosphate-sugar epimerase
MLDPTLEAEGLGPTPFSEALAGDWAAHRDEIAAQLGGARVLMVGAAGTIGGAAVRQLLGFAPARLELVDLDENGLARLARDIRSRGEGAGVAIGFNALDFAGWPGLALAEAAGPFDLVLNFAAVKHVRSEKNRFTLLHMIDVNVVRQRRFAAHLAAHGLARRHFVVSTDKAADPASFMGATKLLLEAVAFGAGEGEGAPLSTAARFANVAYSSGSLLESYLQRFEAGQALAAPRDTRRYFISARDGARICLLAQFACAAGRIAAPKFDPASGAVELADTAATFLRARRRAGSRLCGAAHPARHCRRERGRGLSRSRRERRAAQSRRAGGAATGADRPHGADRGRRCAGRLRHRRAPRHAGRHRGGDPRRAAEFPPRRRRGPAG